MNTKSLSEIEPVPPPAPNWDRLISCFSYAFQGETFYLDQDRYELRIGHTVVVHPAWATEHGRFCYVDRIGQAWCPTGEEDVYVEAEGRAVPAWQIGWLEPFQGSYAWHLVPNCIYTDEDLVHHLDILLPVVDTVWDMLSGYDVRKPESDDEVVGLLWVGME